jgi:hypothetical protein
LSWFGTEPNKLTILPRRKKERHAKHPLKNEIRPWRKKRGKKIGTQPTHGKRYIFFFMNRKRIWPWRKGKQTKKKGKAEKKREHKNDKEEGKTKNNDDASGFFQLSCRCWFDLGAGDLFC